MTGYSEMGANPARILAGIEGSLLAHQWVRESFHNSRDAGADKCHFGVYDMFGVKKRFILDNGWGMMSKSAAPYCDDDVTNWKSMIELMDLGVSGNEDDHFGVGAKASMLLWNQFGLLYISKKITDHATVTSAVWLAVRDGKPVFLDVPTEDGLDANPVLFIQDNDGGYWYDEVALAWLSEHLDGTTPWTLLDEEATGTVAVLLGNKPDDGTDDGNPAFSTVENTNRGIVKYLTERYLDLSEVDVKQAYLHNEQTGEWANRGTPGLIPAIRAQCQTEDGMEQGVFTCTDGTQIHWLIDRDGVERAVNDPESLTTRGGEQFTVHSQVVITYKGENYVQMHMKKLGHWGISAKKLQKFTHIVVEPPVHVPGTGNYGCYPNQPRTGLVMKGTDGDGTLPLEKWQEEFRQNFPPQIAKLQDMVGMGGLDSDVEESIKKSILDHVQMLLDVKHYKDIYVPGKGPEKVDPTHEVGSGNKDGEVENPGGKSTGIGGDGPPKDLGVKGTKTGGRKRRVKDGMIKWDLCRDHEMDEPHHLVELAYTGDVPLLRVNVDHDYTKREVDRWVTDYQHLDGEEVASSIQYAIGGQAALAYGRLQMDPTITKKDKEIGSDLLSPDVLAMSARMPIDHVVKPRLAQR